MGSVPKALAADLKDALKLVRAVETGTYEGTGTRILAGVFPSVVTIELSAACHEVAKERLKDFENVNCILGDSRSELSRIVDPGEATFFFLDGHWCEGPTAGADSQCPLLEELAILKGGHPDDCVVIDDAKFFLASPPPPYNPENWPPLLEVLEALRVGHPAHHLTIVGDQIVAVPPTAKAIVDRYVRSQWRSPIQRLGRRILGRYLLPWSPTRRFLRRIRRRLRNP